MHYLHLRARVEAPNIFYNYYRQIVVEATVTIIVRIVQGLNRRTERRILLQASATSKIVSCLGETMVWYRNMVGMIIIVTFTIIFAMSMIDVWEEDVEANIIPVMAIIAGTTALGIKKIIATTTSLVVMTTAAKQTILDISTMAPAVVTNVAVTSIAGITKSIASPPTQKIGEMKEAVTA